MRKMNHGCAIEVKTVNAAGELEGYGSTFGNVDLGFDIVEPGAFADSLKDRGLPKMLWGHDFFDPPIGKWTEATEDKTGLFLKGQINLDMQRGHEVHSALKMGSLDGLSIGFSVQDSDIDRRGVRHLEKVDLFEVSVVTFPMNEEARVDAVKQLVEKGVTERQLEKILRDAGFSRKQAMALVASGYDGLIARDAADEDDDDEFKELVSQLTP